MRSDTETRRKAIRPALVEIGRAVGLESLEENAEAAEETEQANLLRAIGCDEAQGFLYARGLPEDQLIEFLAKRRDSATA